MGPVHCLTDMNILSEFNENPSRGSGDMKQDTKLKIQVCDLIYLFQGVAGHIFQDNFCLNCFSLWQAEKIPLGCRSLLSLIRILTACKRPIFIKNSKFKAA